MRRIIALLVTLFCVAVLPLRTCALDFDPNWLRIEFENAPEGTQYIDLLVKMDRSDPNWLDFAGQLRYDNGYSENVAMPIGENSEIAKFDSDGYVSFSMHSSLCKRLYFGKNDMHIELSCSAEELYDRYSWKAAYVDAQGNVLGITQEASKSYDIHSPYAMVLNGEKLKFRIWGCSPLTFILIIAAVLVVLAFGVYLMFVSAKFVVDSKKYLHEYAEDEKRAEDELRRR